METKKIMRITASTGASFAILKAFRNSAYPYTRIALGSLIGLGLITFGGNELKAIGIGTGIGAFLQGTEIAKGGRITKNNINVPIYVLHETEGIKFLEPNTIPDYNCDGLTFPGLKAVFKIADGVHCAINADKSISVPGLGAFINNLKDGGLHDLDWCIKTGDQRWIDLYNKSL